MPGTTKAPSPNMLRVFVSSTSKDLEEYRAAARHVILDLGWHPRMMEHFGASPDPTVDACFKALDECDLVLLLVAFRRGWVPSAEQRGNGRDSITQLELNRAQEQGTPVLAMLARDTWPGNLWEDYEEARKWVKGFRDGLNLPAIFFEYEAPTDHGSERLPSFRSKVREVLVKHKNELVEKQKGVHLPVGGIDYFESARAGLADGTAVPFLGPGIYEGGPLGCERIAREIAGDLPEAERCCLATASEFGERLSGSRGAFLQKLRKGLEEQQREAKPTKVHELMLRLDNSPLIVSASYDTKLETMLDEIGEDYAVISHVVRSYDGVHDGKILVLRRNGSAEFCMADKVDVRDAKRILYKPLGSPFFHDRLDPDLDIDTVVATETDHLTFLGRLENQQSQIPTMISRHLQRRPVIFLGYGLDVWQYRLVIQVFRAGSRRRETSTWAVREPRSPMEEAAWDRLGAELIRMNSGLFAEKTLAELHTVGGA